MSTPPSNAPPPPNLTVPRAGLPRAADIAFAATGLIVTSPILVLALIAIPMESRGSPIYRQRRTGAGGSGFELYKLRTMRQGSEPLGVGTAVIAADPRVTRVGAVLRRFSLDELPNLVNVLRGDLAIVGPRPTLDAQVALYTPRQRRRLEVKPGITGWAQVNGRAGIPWEERIELDIWYVENRSVLLDLRILARSVKQLVGGRGLAASDPYAGSAPESPLRQAAEREQVAERAQAAQREGANEPEQTRPGDS